MSIEVGESGIDMSEAPNPRLCHLIKWPDFDGYGFNLHAERDKRGQYIGKIDEASPAQMAGLREGDRIIEVNGVNISCENHRQVVERIKSEPSETRLLVLNRDADQWYRERDLIVRSSQLNVVYIKTPVPRPTADSPRAIAHSLASLAASSAVQSTATATVQAARKSSETEAQPIDNQSINDQTQTPTPTQIVKSKASTTVHQVANANPDVDADVNANESSMKAERVAQSNKQKSDSAKQNNIVTQNASDDETRSQRTISSNNNKNNTNSDEQQLNSHNQANHTSTDDVENRHVESDSLESSSLSGAVAGSATELPQTATTTNGIHQINVEIHALPKSATNVASTIESTPKTATATATTNMPPTTETSQHDSVIAGDDSLSHTPANNELVTSADEPQQQSITTNKQKSRPVNESPESGHQSDTSESAPTKSNMSSLSHSDGQQDPEVLAATTNDVVIKNKQQQQQQLNNDKKKRNGSEASTSASTTPDLTTDSLSSSALSSPINDISRPASSDLHPIVAGDSLEEIDQQQQSSIVSRTNNKQAGQQHKDFVVSKENNNKPQQQSITSTTINNHDNNNTNFINNNSSGLNLNMSASEMRRLIAGRKKFDPKKAQMNIRQKYEIIQQM